MNMGAIEYIDKTPTKPQEAARDGQITQIVIPIAETTPGELADTLTSSLEALSQLILVIEAGQSLVGYSCGPVSCMYVVEDYVTYLKAVVTTLREAMRGDAA
jgi:hypothetical protein